MRNIEEKGQPTGLAAEVEIISTVFNPELQKLLTKIESWSELTAEDIEKAREYMKRIPNLGRNETKGHIVDRSLLQEIFDLLGKSITKYEEGQRKKEIAEKLGLNFSDFTVLRDNGKIKIIKLKSWSFSIIEDGTDKVLAEWVSSISVYPDFEIFDKNRESFVITNYWKIIPLNKDNFKILNCLQIGSVIYSDNKLYSMTKDIEQEIDGESIKYFILRSLYKSKSTLYRLDFEETIEHDVWFYYIISDTKICMINLDADWKLFTLRPEEADEIIPTGDVRFWKIRRWDLYGMYDLKTWMYIWWEKNYTNPNIRIEEKDGNTYLVVPGRIKDNKIEIRNPSPDGKCINITHL